MAERKTLVNVVFCLFTRYPEAGKAKTRLAATLGGDRAALLHREMTEHTLRILGEACRTTGAGMQVRYTGADECAMRVWLGNDVLLVEQGGGDLGARMERAIGDLFADGAKKVIIVGSDCPEITVRDLIEACDLLDRHACVLGPATDGGYYLIGLSRPVPGLFDGIAWSTEHVLEQTLVRLENSCGNHSARGPDYAVLIPLSDVDRPEDVPATISVIIPTLNEERTIAQLVRSALAAFRAECIVVDGGSRDNTCENAAQAGARVFSSVTGRAVQMNLGAAEAGGDFLLFLHADSALPHDWARAVRNLMRGQIKIMGAFTFKLDANSWKARCVEWGVRFRCRAFSLPYGDQGFFLTRRFFEQLGGFPVQPILEDLALVRNVKRRGGKIRLAASPLVTSARRWQKLGYAGTVFLNQCVLLAHTLGVPLERLRACYAEGKNPLCELFRKRRRTS